MNTYEHLVHFAWPLVVATFHRWVLDKLIQPIWRAIVSAVKPEKLAEKLVEKTEEVLEHKLEKRQGSGGYTS